MSLFTEDQLMLSKLLRALMAYYGPVSIINAVIIETDIVIRDMATAGYIREAKEYTAMLERIRESVT